MSRRLAISLVVVATFAVGVVLYACRANRTCNRRNLVHGDSTYYYFTTGTTLQAARALGWRRAFGVATGHMKALSALHYLAVIPLCRVLPLSTSVAPLLNGIWYVLMAISLCLFMWRQTRSAQLSILLPLPLLIAGGPLSGAYQGLGDLHVNLLGYTLGTSTMCFILCSDHLRNRGMTVAAGICLGLLILGRVFSVALVAVAVAPFVLSGLIVGSKAERKRTFVGLAMLSGLGLLTSGWWLVPRIPPFWTHVFGESLGVPGGAVGVGSFRDNARIWLGVAKGLFVYNHNPGYYPMALVLSWIAGVQIATGRSLRDLVKRVNWQYLWLGFSPLLVLIVIRSGYRFYGWPALLGIYLAVVFPFRAREGTVNPLGNRVFRLVLLLSICLASVCFLREMRRDYRRRRTSKANALRVARAILHHESGVPKREVGVGITYYGALNFATLANVFLFDCGCAVAPPDYLPDAKVPPTNDAPRILMPAEITQRPLEWDRGYSKDETETVENALEAIAAQADYVVTLAPASWGKEPPRYPKYWPQWVELSRRLRSRPDFQPLTPALAIGENEIVQVLVRARKR